jgi:hypothetical protein
MSNRRRPAHPRRFDRVRCAPPNDLRLTGGDSRCLPSSMLTVRVQGQNYRISNETLDRLFGANWRSVNSGSLKNSIRQHYEAGRLIVRGQRLQVASASEEAQHLLRSAETTEEILRWGLLYAVSQLATIADELRALREARQFDASAATEKLSRDPAADG